MNKIQLQTERLVLVQPSIHVLERRLVENNFTGSIIINDKDEAIIFPEEWGEYSKIIFPFEIERKYKLPQDSPFWLYIIIDRKTKHVIGDIGCKSTPNKNGEVEIGYGINNSLHGKGYATEAVKILSKQLLKLEEVETITAECNEDNIPSIKVLQKNNFVKTGMRTDEEDGKLILWEKKF